MMYRRTLNRRTLLRGTGSIVIGLPFLNEMISGTAYGASGTVPVRAFNVFFGLGIPTPLHGEGFAGVFEPLEQVQHAMSILRGVDQVRADRNGDNAHFDGAAASFTASRPPDESRAGGPSLDTLLFEHAYPEGLPNSVLSPVLMGTYFRRSRRQRYVQNWKRDGSPLDTVRETPRALFDRLFGSAPELDGNARSARLRRSVLDSVTEQYRYWQSDASSLSRASRARIADHLDRVREYEQRAFSEEPIIDACASIDEPTESNIPHGNAADPSGTGIDITMEDLRREWRLMSELFALGVHCDRIRGGGATFLAAGERIRMTGRYEYKGRLIYDFDDRRDRAGRSGAQACSHEFWHDFREDRDNTELRAHVHFTLNEVAYLLQQLDDDTQRDANGKTVLENALVLVSTESGDGRHGNVTRELSGIFHAISSACGAVKTGGIIDADAEGLDVYNTVLTAMGVTQKLGPGGRAIETVE
ncbi:MAG: DUF1552 domain-containing protein, partial [Myxococcota bacterium]